MVWFYSTIVEQMPLLNYVIITYKENDRKEYFLLS